MPEAIKVIFERHERGRDALIPILQDVQGELGYISPQSVAAISRYLRISENEIFGVSSFYAQFRFRKPGRHSVKVCLGTACHVRGGSSLLDSIESKLGVACGETTQDRRYDLERVACLGCCALSPVVQVDGKIFSKITVNKLTELLKYYE
ncbi:MAG: NAD(P)H-dependent oxidoreductase subunit E [Syntrophorhabdales bacterium]|jgi:NADH-quinone oxidoreductase subunit E